MRLPPSGYICRAVLSVRSVTKATANYLSASLKKGKATCSRHVRPTGSVCSSVCCWLMACIFFLYARQECGCYRCFHCSPEQMFPFWKNDERDRVAVCCHWLRSVLLCSARAETLLWWTISFFSCLTSCT